MVEEDDITEAMIATADANKEAHLIKSDKKRSMVTEDTPSKRAWTMVVDPINVDLSDSEDNVQDPVKAQWG